MEDRGSGRAQGDADVRSVRRRRWRHGSGAAIEAKQLGIDVLLLEKKSQTGGSRRRVRSCAVARRLAECLARV